MVSQRGLKKEAAYHEHEHAHLQEQRQCVRENSASITTIEAWW